MCEPCANACNGARKVGALARRVESTGVRLKADSTEGDVGVRGRVRSPLPDAPAVLLLNDGAGSRSSRAVHCLFVYGSEFKPSVQYTCWSRLGAHSSALQGKSKNLLEI